MRLEDKIKKIVASPILWIENFVSIVDKNGRLVKFKLNPQQKYLLKNMEQKNIVVKSRQLGITSAACAYSLYLCHTGNNNVCMIMAHSLDGADTIFKKLKQQYEDLPPQIKLETIANNRKELTFINGSRIIVSVCGAKESVRGSTLKFVHLSEVGFMNDNLPNQLLAIEQSLRNDGVIILESTANGLNYFADLWGRAERKESTYKPFFFGWIKDKIMFADKYKQAAEKYTNVHGALPHEDELDDTEKSLFRRGASMDMIVWRRLVIADSGEAKFKQEYPSNPVECFISTGSNIFSTKKILESLDDANSSKVLPIPSNLPLALKPWYKSALDIWELPKPNGKYYLGCDCSEGLGGANDYSVIEVLDQDCNQVAEFKSNKAKPHQFAEIINALGRFYNNGLVAVERASAGLSVIERLRYEYSYMNMYKYRDRDKKSGKAKSKLGFDTNAKTKPIMIADFVEFFETNQIYIVSKALLGEMKLFTYKDGKMEAQNGSHDDHVMAMAIAIQAFKNKIMYYMD